MIGLVDKNTGTNGGRTPFHFAAENKDLSICRLIMETVLDKNPATNDETTPFDLAESDEYKRLLFDLDGGLP